MSILIKGMDMPSNCTECRLTSDGWCYAIEAWDHRYDDIRNDKRPEWCPLVEVLTPHGRLIDANETYNKAVPVALSCDNEKERAWFIHGIGFIAGTPTIIEAEE